MKIYNIIVLKKCYTDHFINRLSSTINYIIKYSSYKKLLKYVYDIVAIISKLKDRIHFSTYRL